MNGGAQCAGADGLDSFRWSRAVKTEGEVEQVWRGDCAEEGCVCVCFSSYFGTLLCVSHDSFF